MQVFGSDKNTECHTHINICIESWVTVSVGVSRQQNLCNESKNKSTLSWAWGVFDVLCFLLKITEGFIVCISQMWSKSKDDESKKWLMWFQDYTAPFK